MKKIFTLSLMMLLMASFGYSQSLPIDFSDPLDDNFTSKGNAVYSHDVDPVDNLNQVAKINGGDAMYDSRIDLSLDTYIDLTTASKTITFRFYTTEAVVMAGLFQVNNEKDGGYVIEVPFTTNGQIGWETITCDFSTASNGYPNGGEPVVFGNYGGLSVFTNFGDTGSSIYYVDDIAGAVNGDPIAPEAMPGAPAQDPTVDEANVISVYSDVYMNEAVVWDLPWGQLTSFEEVDIDGNNVAKLSSFSYEGLGSDTDPATTFSIASMTRVHFDVWSENETSIKFHILDGDTEPGVTKTITTEQWNSIDMPLTDFTNLLTGACWGVKLESGTYSWPNGVSTVYIDNVYFYNSTPTAVSDLEMSSLKLYPNPVSDVLRMEDVEEGAVIEIYGATGSLVKSGQVQGGSISVANLSQGVYFVKVNGSTAKIIKK